MPAVYRHQNSKGDWYYTLKNGTAVTDKKTLDYISGLAVPPAYKDVVIYTTGNPRILFHGVDSKGRAQFIYSESHNRKALKTKLCNLVAFGEALPSIRASIIKSLKGQRWTKHKVAALVLRIADNCHMRLGTEKYKDLYGSTGLTTIEEKHLTFSPDNKQVCIEFVGKKGVLNKCVTDDQYVIEGLKDIIRQNRPKAEDHILGYTHSGIWEHILHTDVNDFLKTFGPTFTSKMFRTWASNMYLIRFLRGTTPTSLTPAKRRKEIVSAIKQVATLVQNTPAICKKSYIDNDLIEMYLEKPVKYRKTFITGQTDERTMFLKFLKSKCGD